MTAASRKNTTVFALWLIILMVARMVAHILMHPLAIGWDPALHLQCAQLITQGGVPYVDMFDVNPPLIWYMDTLPVLVGNLMAIPLTLSFNFFMVGIMTLAALSCAWLVVTRLPQTERFANLGLIFGLLYFNFFLRYDFGQREEIFALLYLPYLLFRLARYRGASFNIWQAVFFGLMGAVGICLKHYFVIVAGLVEFALLMRYGGAKKILAVENVTVAAFAVLYLAHFLFAPKAMLDNYFNFLVPAFARGYQFWDTCLANSLGAPDKRGVFLLCALGLFLALGQLKRAAVLLPLAVFALSSVIPYLMQFKGWTYHDIPVFAGSVMLITTAGAALLERVCRHFRLPSAFLPLASLCVISGMAFMTTLEELSTVSGERQFALSRLGYGEKMTSPWSDIDSPFTDYLIKYTKPGSAVIFISNGVSPGYPLMTQFALAPGSRHLHCCILSVLQYIKETLPAKGKVAELLAREPAIIDEYGADIEKRKPSLIFIQEAPVSEYLRPHGFYEKYLRHYKKIGSAANFDIYHRFD